MKRPPHEYWRQLETARRQKRICLERVGELKTACAAKCREPHISKCLDCYSDVLDAMRQRYRESRGHEWFHQRSTFLNSLDSLFSEAMEHQSDPGAVEAWVAEQKKTWYRSELALLDKMLAAAALPAFSPAEFQRLTARGGASVDELAAMVWRTAGRPESWWPQPDQIRSRLRARGGSDRAADKHHDDDADNDDEPKHAYVDILFRDQATGEYLSDDARAWADAYLADDARRLVDVMEEMAQAHEAWKARAPERESCRRRLDELRRGAAAVMQKKALSSKAGDGRRNQLASHLDKLPPCAACSMSVGAKVISCAVCQAFVEVGVGDAMTVYCSRGCFDQVQGSHAQQAHDCEAGDHCVAMTDDSGVAPEPSEPVLCTECVKSLGRPAIYCSLRCAGQHFQQHREAVHLPARAKAQDSQALAHDQDKTQNDSAQLVYDNESKTKYHAADIGALVMRLGDTLERLFREKHPRATFLGVE